MLPVLLVLGVLTAIFVGTNIGGSSTGVAWGPSVGAGIVTKTFAAGLMTVFVFLGGWTVGRNVIDTLGTSLVPEEAFTLEASVVVLLFVGLGMLSANLYGVPVSTSMTTVGAISGYGYATGTLNLAVLGGIVIWWIVAPILGFWLGGVVGRYLYPHLDRYFAVATSEGSLVTLDLSARLPLPRLGPGTTGREFANTVLVFAIGCYMAFSAGASNVANAVAPLVGSGVIGVDAAIVLASAAIGLGAFSIARRTMAAVGNDITDLPLLAATIVMVVGASITTALSWIGIPISLALSTVMCIVGLGWGRATRSATAREIVTGEAVPAVTVDALTAEVPEEPPPVGEADVAAVADAEQLFDPSAVFRFVAFWIVGPTLSTGLSYACFVAVPLGGGG